MQENNEEKGTLKRKRKRKQKSSDSHNVNGANNERNNKEENNFVGIANKNEGDSDNKVNPSKKLQRST